MTTSKFISGDRSYIEEAANYLQERGLTIQELPVDAYHHADLGFYTKRKGGSDMFEPFVLEGWAFQVRKQDGAYYDDRWLLRVCNWPKEQLYQRRGGRICIVNGNPPKFIQLGPKGADLTNFVSSVEDLCHSKVVMFHEKFTSAALAVKLLNFPSIALSGCTNWSQDGRVKDGILYIIENMEPGAKLVACFDGDLINNPNVMHAASQLKGWVHSIRPDITCVFPMVPTMPEGKNGWDDWVVWQGDNAKSAWTDLLTEDGVTVTTALPLQYLVSEYQVKTKTLKDKVVIEHTAANYRRLMRHPLWCNYSRDVLGGIYNKDEMLAGRLTMDDLYRKYEMWLADCVFVGDGAGVRSLQVKEAVREEMAYRTESIAHAVIGEMPEVTEQQAMDSALRMITEGIMVTGPMTQHQTAETIIRIFRDMVAMWSNDHSIDPQWALVLIGPSGCGKSNFPKSILAPLAGTGYRTSAAQLAKDGNRSNIDELLRQCRDCHIGTFDEYNPDDKNARLVEQNMFTLTSQRFFSQRRLHEEDSSDNLRHASIFLTTVDKNEKFIRSMKGAGERRFIILNVQGVRPGPDGIMSSDRSVIAECAAVLLRYGLQMHNAGDYALSATEYSRDLTSAYISASPVEARIAKFWARQDLSHVLEKFKAAQFRAATGDIRWSPTQMYEALAPGERISRQDGVDITNIVAECGAIMMGKGRVNAPGGDIIKDKIYGVAESDWGIFLDALMGRFGA